MEDTEMVRYFWYAKRFIKKISYVSKHFKEISWHDLYLKWMKYEILWIIVICVI